MSYNSSPTPIFSLVEPMVAWLVENRGLTRVKASVISGGIIWVVGVSVAFSFNIWSEFKLFDKTIFDFLDDLTAKGMLPIGGFCIAIFVGWIMQTKHVEEELNMSAHIFKGFQFLVRFVAPISLVLVFLHVLGVF